MKANELKQVDLKDRKNEKGAALVMVLLISFLLLIASAGILLEVTLNTANVTDATAEQQAYNAAESGIQATLNVLRGHTIPSPLLDANKPAGDAANRIDFKKALTLSQSNTSADSSTDPRLSRWLKYNYTPSNSLITDRITLGTNNYNPLKDNAYKVVISDPDNTRNAIAFTTIGSIEGGGSSKTIGDAVNNLQIEYVPSVNTGNIDVSAGNANTNFGKFKFKIRGAGAAILEDVRFSIRVEMSFPYTGTRIIRGFFRKGNFQSGTLGGLIIDYDSKKYLLLGSEFELNEQPQNPVATSAFEATAELLGTITPAEPIRILVKSTGFGPRGAIKELEAVVQKNFFNGLSAPATLTMVGSSTGFKFVAGSSQNVSYSGDDVASDFRLPPIGTTNQQNLDAVNANFSGKGTKADVDGTPSDVTFELPTWLESTENLDATLQALKNVAKSSGRYFANGQVPTTFGDPINAKGITYVDGDLEIAKEGGGILIVTGKLKLRGGFDFSGLIIVTGAEGVERSGGGNGYLHGNIVVSPYDSNNLAAGFSGPKYEIAGGGTSEVRYNSSSLANGLTAVSNFVLGVAEK